MPRKMKDSGVEWIGQVPEGWRVGSIKHHYEIILGKMLASEQQNDTDTLEKYFCAANVHFDGGADATNLKEMWFSVDEKRSYKVESGDLLVVEGGAGAGGAAVVQSLPFDAYVQNSILIVRGKNVVANAYAGYLLEVLVKSGYVDYVSNKATIPHFTKEKVGGVPLPLPPADELGKITEYLDTQCAEIDAAIASARQSIEDYTALKKSLIQEITFAGVSRDVRLKDTRVSWIGELPESWPTIPLKYLLTEVNVRSETGEEEPLSMSQKLGIVPSRMISVANPATSYIGAKIVEKGDLVFNKLKAHLGVFAISEYQGLVSPDYAVYRSQGNVDMRYLVRIFHTPKCIAEFKRYISGIGAGLSRLYTSDLFRIKVPCPPLAEQRVIADILDEKCAAIDALVAEKEALIADLESYKKSLIFEVVTGKREVA